VKAYRKTIVAVVLAVCVTLGTVLEDGAISSADWFVVAAAVLGAIGVYQVPNETE
jgi:hypothetical protein